MTENKKAQTTLSEKIQAKWNKFSEGDVRDIGSDMSVLANKLASVYSRSKKAVQKEIAEFQKALPK